MSVASRAPSLVLLGLVVVAAALLIAGYGAAVGVGVVVGLLLGLAAFLAILAMNPVTRGGASYSFDAASRSSDQSDHDAIRRYHVDWMRVAAVDTSGLRRVIAGGTSVDAEVPASSSSLSSFARTAASRPSSRTPDRRLARSAASSTSPCPTTWARPTSGRARARADRTRAPAGTMSDLRRHPRDMPPHS